MAGEVEREDRPGPELRRLPEVAGRAADRVQAQQRRARALAERVQRERHASVSERDHGSRKPSSTSAVSRGRSMWTKWPAPATAARASSGT